MVADVSITTELVGAKEVQASIDRLTQKMRSGWGLATDQVALSNQKLAASLAATQAKTAGLGMSLSLLPRLSQRVSAGFQQIAQGFGRFTSTVGAGLQGTVRAVDGFEGRLLSLRSVILAVVGSQAIRALVDYASQWQNTSVRIAQFTSSATEARAVQDLLFASAQRTGTAFSATAEIFARFAPVISDMGGSAGDTVRIVDQLNKIVATSGATSVEASNALRQLSQGFATGRIRGDELRSVMEQFPGLLRIIARDTSQTTSGLIASARENGLAVEAVIQALRNQGDEIDRQFDNMGTTMSRATTQVQNAFTRIIGRAFEASGAMSSLTGLVVQFAEYLSSAAAERAATAFFGKLTDALRTFMEGFGHAANAFKELWAGNFAAAAAEAGKFITTLDSIKLGIGEADFAAAESGAAMRLAFDDARGAVIRQNAEIRLMRDNLGGLRPAAADAADALKGVAGVLKDLEDENELLKLNTRQRQIRTAVIKAEEAAIKAKTTLTDAERSLVEQLAAANFDLQAAEKMRLDTAKEGADAFREAGETAISGLTEQLELIKLTEREQAIQTELTKAQNEAMKEGNLLTMEQVEQIKQLAGALHDATERRKTLAELDEEAAKQERDNWNRTIATITDTTIRWSTIVEGIHRSFQTMFFGLSQNLIGFVQGAKNATDVIKGFFEDLANVILQEFARIAASQVFRVLFGAGAPGSGTAGGMPGTPATRGAAQAGVGEALGGGGLIGGAVGSSGLLAGAVGTGLLAGGAGFLTGQLLQGIGLNKTISTIGGALTGAAIGFAIGGPVGAVIGGLGGGFGGFFQHGGEFITKGPQFIGVGEAGPEHVQITPLSGGRRSSNVGGVTVVLNGPTILDDLSMMQFERRIARAVGAQQRRIV